MRGARDKHKVTNCKLKCEALFLIKEGQFCRFVIYFCCFAHKNLELHLNEPFSLLKDVQICGHKRIIITGIGETGHKETGFLKWSI